MRAATIEEIRVTSMLGDLLTAASILLKGTGWGVCSDLSGPSLIVQKSLETPGIEIDVKKILNENNYPLEIVQALKMELEKIGCFRKDLPRFRSYRRA